MRPLPRTWMIAIAVVALSGGTAAADQPVAPQLRNAGFVALNVADINRTAEFYRALGFTEDFRRDIGSGTMIGLLAPAETMLGPHLLLTANADRKEPLVKGSVFSRVAWAVRNVAAMCQKAMAASGKPCTPNDNKTNRSIVAISEDPEGNRVEFVENY